MLENLRNIRDEIKIEIDNCEEIMGQWNGDESGALEDRAGIYGDVQSRLKESYTQVLEAIVILHNK